VGCYVLLPNLNYRAGRDTIYGPDVLQHGSAEHDDLAPLPMVEELRGLFRRAGTAGEIELYPGVHHGFAFPQRWCYDKPAAERHWERLIALYRRRLG
jgi:dienelactone hydrolase